MTTCPRSFYVPLGQNQFEATQLCASLWSAEAQHGGPPAALLARVLEEQVHATPEAFSGMFTRLTFEFMGPIPIEKLSVTTRTLRHGRRISLHEATLYSESGQAVMLCRAWRVATTNLSLPLELNATGKALLGPEKGTAQPFFKGAPPVGYHQCVEARFLKGSWRAPGEATAWMRTLIPLLSNEDPSPLVGLLIVADSANGVGSALNPSEWLFINPEATIHLHAYPDSKWIGLESSAAIESYGIGLTSTKLHGVGGPIGSIDQTLMVAKR